MKSLDMRVVVVGVAVGVRGDPYQLFTTTSKALRHKRIPLFYFALVEIHNHRVTFHKLCDCQLLVQSQLSWLALFSNSVIANRHLLY